MISGEVIELNGQSCWLTIVHDITDRLKIEEALQESERKARAVFEQTYEFIGLLNLDGILLEASRAALEFYELTESDVIGKPFWETSWWTHSTELQARLRDAVQEASAGGFVHFEAFHPAPAGIIHYVDVSIKPAKGDNGEVLFLVVEGRDITDRKEAERGLKASEEKLKEAQSVAHIGSWDWNIDRGDIQWSEEMFKILGIADEYTCIS